MHIKVNPPRDRKTFETELLSILAKKPIKRR